MKIRFRDAHNLHARLISMAKLRVHFIQSSSGKFLLLSCLVSVGKQAELARRHKMEERKRYENVKLVRGRLIH